MKLSVIIPVYNVERTLDSCVRSVLSQNVPEMEVVLVDDGSTDSSSRLCDDWQARDYRIRVLHKQNGGLSDARNHGISHSSGEVLTFVDSDDEIAPETFAPLMERMSQIDDCEVLEYPVAVRAGHPSERFLALKDKVWDSVRAYWTETEAWEHSYACNKFYRREVFSKVQFPVGRAFEDAWFFPELLQHCHKIATTTKGKYIYRWNEEGITVKAEGAETLQLLESLSRAADLMHTKIYSKNGWKLYRSMFFRQLDVYRLTGKILLKFPFCRLICELHKRYKR